MKTIGRTNDGCYLVEMNDDEHKALARLAGAAGGWNQHRAIQLDYKMVVESAIDKPLNAVHSYSHSLEMINELLDQLKRVRVSLEQN